MDRREGTQFLSSSCSSNDPIMVVSIFTREREMLKLNWVLFLLNLLLFFLPSMAAGLLEETGNPLLCSAMDREALLGFKAGILKDTTGILNSWIGTDCCGSWEAIQCNPSTGRIVAFQVQRSQGRDDDMLMKGMLSHSLGNLRFLEILVISGMKQIRGPIPESLSKLNHLTQLYLENNMLEGIIPPSLGGLKSLKAFSLNGNRLQGVIPSSLSALKNLIQINLGRNFLTGSIPSTFRKLNGLQALDLSHNLLSGSIPDFVGHFQNLTFLDLSYNNFIREIPISICSLSNALDISLSHNKLTGQIPTQIGKLRSLTTLSLSENYLLGPIPDSIATLQNLWYLNLSRNGFKDPLPESFSNGIPSLMSIDLSYNDLHLESIPEWLMSRDLRDLHLAGCSIKGTIPKLQGTLSSIDLSDNYLTGDIKTLLTNMEGLEKIKLSNNQLRFDIAGTLLPNVLSSLDLHSNQLYGSVSSHLFQNSNKFLEIINLSNNNVTGKLPEILNGSGLKWLDLSRNGISGKIPPSISILIRLEKLDLSRNKMEGVIPSSIGMVVNLEWLDLSSNGLTGMIPGSLLGLRKVKHANFRNNRLCGEIPQGRPFNLFKSAAYAHNQCLCGKPLPPCN